METALEHGNLWLEEINRPKLERLSASIDGLEEVVETSQSERAARVDRRKSRWSTERAGRIAG